jgi:hypothetical protein
MQELSQIGLMPEMWGGDTPMIQVFNCHHMEAEFHSIPLLPV